MCQIQTRLSFGHKASHIVKLSSETSYPFFIVGLNGAQAPGHVAESPAREMQKHHVGSGAWSFCCQWNRWSVGKGFCDLAVHLSEPVRRSDVPCGQSDIMARAPIQLPVFA